MIFENCFSAPAARLDLNIAKRWSAIKLNANKFLNSGLIQILVSSPNHFDFTTLSGLLKRKTFLRIY